MGYRRETCGPDATTCRLNAQRNDRQIARREVGFPQSQTLTCCHHHSHLLIHASWYCLKLLSLCGDTYMRMVYLRQLGCILCHVSRHYDNVLNLRYSTNSMQIMSLLNTLRFELGSIGLRVPYHGY